jgi:hypothetical protein
VGFISATSQIAYDDVRIEPDIVPEIAEAPPQIDAPQPDVVAPSDATWVDSFDGGVGESRWQPLSGDWRIDDGSYTQYQSEGFDLSTVYTQAITYPLRVSAVIAHREGVGGGLLFNLATPDRTAGGHMVRYFEEDGIIAWGYFSDDGVFQGQGSISVTLPGESPHTLEIIADATTYAIRLDGVTLAGDIPIIGANSPGYMGLTASQSVVSFDDVRIDQTTANATPDIDTDLASGNWIIEGNTITQTETAGADYIAGTGLAGERFTISVEITLPSYDPDAGAGIVFHMDGRDDRSLGTMVRLGSGGQEVFWGRYDADGAFTGEGGIPLELPSGEPIKLLLAVGDGSFDIIVNDISVVEELPIEREGGWIGLVSFGGPIAFQDINIQLGD